jgi:hypothetical protein
MLASAGGVAKARQCSIAFALAQLLRVALRIGLKAFMLKAIRSASKRRSCTEPPAFPGKPLHRSFGPAKVGAPPLESQTAPA